MKNMRIALVLALAFTSLTVSGSPAEASCAADPSDISFRAMIRTGHTGDQTYDRMIIGRVVAIRDPRKPGGHARAVVAVAAHPTGWVPFLARVRFWIDRPNVGTPDNFEFHLWDRYVILATHTHDGSFAFDGACGQSSSVSPHRFQSLLRYARAYG